MNDDTILHSNPVVPDGEYYVRCDGYRADTVDGHSRPKLLLFLAVAPIHADDHVNGEVLLASVHPGDEEEYAEFLRTFRATDGQIDHIIGRYGLVRVMPWRHKAKLTSVVFFVEQTADDLVQSIQCEDAEKNGTEPSWLSKAQ